MINELKRHLRRNPRGSNLVEFALVLFILVLLLIAVVDIGRAFHTYITITNASREGARRGARIPQYYDGSVAGATNPDDDIKAATIQEALNSNVVLTDTNILIEPAALTSRLPGTPLTVTVEYTMTTFIGGLIGIPEIMMRSDTEMVLFAGYAMPGSP